MDVFDLQAKITLDSSEFESELARSKSGLEGLITKANLFANAITEAGKKAADVFSDVAESIIKVGTGFDTAMANVAAISGATGDDLDALRDKAKEMGATTKFSASEAADAFGYMAMAGWKTEDMLDGIDGIMQLAAASGEDLSTTSDIVTDALTAFGLSAEDSGHFADILAAASSNANTNVSMMGETFKYIAPLAGTLGYSAEDVAVAVGLMANSGIKAGQAGTSLRAALSSLLNPSEKAAGLMEDLGISMTDVNGNSLPLADTFDMLREAFSGLAESEQASAAALLFGQEAMSGMLSIINAAPADIEKLTEAVANAEGAAANMSEIMQDNVGGAWDEFTSALEGAGIALYETFSDDLQDMILGAADGVSRLTAAFEEGGASGAIDEFVTMLSEMTGLDLSGVVDVFTGIGEAITTIGKGFAEGGIGGGFEAIVGQIESLTGLDLSGIVDVFTGIGEAISEIKTAFAEGGVSGGLDQIAKSFEDMTGLDISDVTDGIKKFAEVAGELKTAFENDGVSGVVDSLIQSFKNSTGIDLTGLVDGIRSFIESFKKIDPETFKKIADAVVLVLQNFNFEGLADLITAIADAMGKFFEKCGEALENGLPVVAEIIRFMSEDFPNLASGVVGAATGIMMFVAAIKAMEIIKGVPAMLSGFKTALSGVFTLVSAHPFALLISALGALVTAFVTAYNTSEEFRDVVNSALNSVKETAQKVVEKISEMITKVGEFFSGAWTKVKGVAGNVLSFFGVGEDAGADLAAGLESGVSSGISGREGRIKKSAGEVTEYFNEKFDRHSPSKVFAEMGRDLMRGLELGIAGEAGNVQRTIDGMRLTAPELRMGRVDYADSAFGRSTKTTVNGLFAAASQPGGGNGQPAVVNLVVDGRTMAQVLFDPLSGVAKQKGVPVGVW